MFRAVDAQKHHRVFDGKSTHRLAAHRHRFQSRAEGLPIERHRQITHGLFCVQLDENRARSVSIGVLTGDASVGYRSGRAFGTIVQRFKRAMRFDNLRMRKHDIQIGESPQRQVAIGLLGECRTFERHGLQAGAFERSQHAHQFCRQKQIPVRVADKFLPEPFAPVGWQHVAGQTQHALADQRSYAVAGGRVEQGGPVQPVL
jgi:hypothetical protein